MRNLTFLATAFVACMALPTVTRADFLPGLKDFDPFNKNGQVGKKLDSAMGGRFTVTLRNPTKSYLVYTFNGERQIALPPGYKRTHTGVGNAEIRFDVGAGDGTFQAYNLGSGQSYHFRWKYVPPLDWSGGGDRLDLYRD